MIIPELFIFSSTLLQFQINLFFCDKYTIFFLPAKFQGNNKWKYTTKTLFQTGVYWALYFPGIRSGANEYAKKIIVA